MSSSGSKKKSHMNSAKAKDKRAVGDHAAGKKNPEEAEGSGGRKKQRVTKPLDVNDLEPLSGKNPYWHLILTESNVNPAYELVLPTELYKHLPSKNVPATIHRREKTWEARFCVDNKGKRIAGGWKHFVEDNHLDVGDVIIWEVLESNKKEMVKLRTQIMRSHISLESLNQEKRSGDTNDTPIVIDDD